MTRRSGEGSHVGDNFRDTGCDLAPSCLNCHLPRCRYDEPDGGQSVALSARQEEVVRRLKAGEDPYAVAADLRITVRTVWRISRLAKQLAGGIQ